MRGPVANSAPQPMQEAARQPDNTPSTCHIPSTAGNSPPPAAQPSGVYNLAGAKPSKTTRRVSGAALFQAGARRHTADRHEMGKSSWWRESHQAQQLCQGALAAPQCSVWSTPVLQQTNPCSPGDVSRSVTDHTGGQCPQQISLRTHCTYAAGPTTKRAGKGKSGAAGG